MRSLCLSAPWPPHPAALSAFVGTDMGKTIIATLLICTLGFGAQAQTTDDAQFEAFNRRAIDKGDCTDYQAMADAALAGRPGGSLVHRVSAAAAICAARDGRFDLTDRLAARFPTSAPHLRDYLVATPYTFMIRRLVDIPGAGPSALAAARRLPDIDYLSSPNIQRTELTAMAAFAAGQDAEGIASLDQVDRRGALSIQADRRFAPAWLPSEQLITASNTPALPPASALGNDWTRELATLDRRGENEATVLATAYRQMNADIANSPAPGDFAPLAMGKTGSQGDGQRAWLVQRLLEDGRVDEALKALDIKTNYENGRSGDALFVQNLADLTQALIRADRTAEADQLLEEWTAAQVEDKAEYVGFSRDDDLTLQPLRALRVCLRGDHTARLEPVDWRVSLICDDPEDRTAALLIDALNASSYRNQTLQAVNLPPIHPALGKADEDYRRRCNALLARPDVAAAVDRYGRRLAPDLAWRLARAYPAF